MKVLITGGSGYIGQYIIRELLNTEFVQIIATTRNLENVKDKIHHSRLTYREFKLDQVKDETFKELGSPDLLIHLAWEGLPNYKQEFHLTKCLPEQKKFLSMMLKTGLKNLTVTGTCFEYGMIGGELTEEMETHPENPYGKAKDELRKYLQTLQNEYQFSLKWLRLFYMYGKGQAPNSLISQLDKAISENSKTFNMSGGEQVRDFLPIDKIAYYIVKSSLQTKVDGVINCCSCQPIKVKDFVQQYLNDKNYKMELNLGFYPYPDYEPMTFWGSNRKLKEVLNAK